jgi:hypothetical protein
MSYLWLISRTAGALYKGCGRELLILGLWSGCSWTVVGGYSRVILGGCSKAVVGGCSTVGLFYGVIVGPL